MNDHDDLSSIDFGSTMKIIFFLNISFRINEKRKEAKNSPHIIITINCQI
jgi:hypothetical protein